MKINEIITEASGYIPTHAERNDPRCLSIDEDSIEDIPVHQVEDNPLMSEFKQFMESANWKMSKSSMTGYQIEQAYWKRQSRVGRENDAIKFQPYIGLNNYIERTRTNTLWESIEIDELLKFQKYLTTLDGRSSVVMKVGASVSVLQFTPLSAFNVVQVTGFKTPKQIKNINKNVDGNIEWIEFTDGSYFPDVEFHNVGKGGEWEGVSTLFFNNRAGAESALMLAMLNVANGWEISTINLVESSIMGESSGYIPSKAERNDPRFKTALSVDVDPEIMPRQAKAMGLGTIKRDGRPQVAKPSGKFTR